MTAEHDGYDGRDGHDGHDRHDVHDRHEGYDGPDRRDGHGDLDALLAVLADEPLPGAARADAAFMTEHRAAAAEVALVREQLKIIGDALAGPAPRPRPQPEPVRPAERRYRRPGARALCFGALVTAAVASAVLGLGRLVANNGVGSDSAAGSASDKSAQSYSSAWGPARLACLRLLVEGDVTKVQPVRGTAEDRVTLRVTRSYIPAQGEDEVSLRVERAVVPDARPGQHVLAGIEKGATNPDLWITGAAGIARERAAIVKALPESGDVSGDAACG
ncbi:hypothetical protein ABZX30_31490 [Streptomyces sp. NPDC004542]|uniref:hypothetical protein n=1 Tax=Streptomyces sp. NPDC004542 TaxID=3154281 RepID=UPI0033A4DBC3